MPATNAGETSGENATGTRPYSPETIQHPSKEGGTTTRREELVRSVLSTRCPDLQMFQQQTESSHIELTAMDEAREDHSEESILFSPLNMSSALHLLRNGSRGESAAQIEQALHLTDEKEHLSPESRENSKETESYDASEDYLHDKSLMNSEALEECIQEAEGTQDGTGQAWSKHLMEDSEVNERPSLQSPETDAGELDRSLSHSSLQSPEADAGELDRSFRSFADVQSISDEGASDSFLSWSENISPEEVEDIESHEQPSSEGIELDSLDNALKNQDGLVVDINSSTEETKVASDNADTDTENIHTTSCIDPENYVNDDTETITGTSSLVIHLVSDVGNKKPITKNHSVESGEGTIPQSDIANVLPKKEDDKFLSQEQSSEEDLQNEMEPSGGDRESMTFQDGRSPSFDTHLDAVKETFLNNPLPKCRHNINTRESNNTETEDRISPQSALPSHETNETMNDFVQTQENSSSRFDSDEDASSDFLPWSDDYPENEDEIISQGQSTPEDNVFVNEISLPQNKQVSFQSSSDTTNSSCSLPATEGTTRLNSDHKKNSTYSENQMNSGESEGKQGKEGKTLSKTKTIQRRQHNPSNHKIDYSQTFAVSSSYNLPWYKYLLGREQRQALMEAWCQVLDNVTAPPASRMYNYVSRIKKNPVASE